MSVLLQVDHLSHHYKKGSAIDTLQQVSFLVEEEQICAIVGESGSGKTTLLHLIGGKLDPHEGSIWLSGKKVTGPAYNLVPGHLDIRTVFQDFALSPNLSVYQNIAHALRAYRRDYREARTHELIKRFRLRGREEQLPATLSGGEKQRVALARALAEEPRLLLLDEPFSQIDTPLKCRLMHEVIAILRETSGTAVLVTHDAHDALSLSDQILVLFQGTVVQQGTPQQVYEQPINPYVAQLMGKCQTVKVSTLRQWYPDLMVRNTTHVGIRPEHVRLLDGGEGIQGSVVQSRYQGAYYETTIKFAEEARVIAHSHQHLATNAAVVFSIATEQLIRYRIPS